MEASFFHRPILIALALSAAVLSTARASGPRSRVLIDNDWRFIKGDPPNQGQPLSYPKPYLLPTANPFLNDPTRYAHPPPGNLGDGVTYISPTFDDSAWQSVNLPHDFAIAGPFTRSGGGGMGRLPTAQVVWYRKTLDLSAADAANCVFLDIDGAMSYSEVWLNGRFIGGWPYGYSSFRLDLTAHVKPGKNLLAIRLDNPPNSSRWYPGGGLYRNVWLVTAAPVHVGQWGTYITTPDVSTAQATVAINVRVDNASPSDAQISVATQFFEIDAQDHPIGAPIAALDPLELKIPAAGNATTQGRATISNPRLWGVGDHQKPNRYLAVTTLRQNGAVVDTYQTPFGIRTLKFDPDNGFFLNGEHIKLNGVCDHHDLGALGAAVNYRALQRQLEILADMGANALRTSHNPPAPELLELADKMGFLVMDEAFDCWAKRKTPNDYHLLYPDWHEQDLRAFLRRDRNHPSVIMWSIGNEVGEQSSGAAGAAIARHLTGICHDEDPTRPTISAMNSARADSPFPNPIDLIGLNYQGAGLFRGQPQYPVFHRAYPGKMIVGSETTDTFSSRGFYTFPVTAAPGTPAAPRAGENPGVRQVSSYDLYHASWSYAPDKEFAAQDRYPFVAGEFVWTGFDYLGEPTPFDSSRSSYCGIIDLAGFKKDRFYLYQAHWRPQLPMAHILPDWTWPDRLGKVTPVQVYTSGDEAELFLNGKSLGREKKAPFQYRLRWDDVVYEPGELRVVAYKNGQQWATDSVTTTGPAARLVLTPDRAQIAADGKDLSFVTLAITDENGRAVPRSSQPVHFQITGPAEIAATDNGDPTDMTPFGSNDRNAFNGLALAIVRGKPGQAGSITVTASSGGLKTADTVITAK